MAVTINASTTAGLVNTADTSGILQLQTANTTAVTVDASQNVTVVGVTTLQAGTAALPALTTTGDTNTGIFFPAADTIAFSTGGAERARIDSGGNFMVGGTNVAPASGNVVGFAAGGSGYISVSRSSGLSAEFNRIGTDGDNIALRKAGTQVGSISVTASATAYNTSSDYRLKNTITPMTGALAKIALLKPVTYKWNADDSNGEGFIAHELAEVCPNAVNGEKDAIDENGNPKYQGIDTSFLVATLTAAIQEQQALITQLQADVATLKGTP